MRRSDFWCQKDKWKDVVEIPTFSILSKLLLKPTIIMSICYPLVIPTWNPLLSFTWNSIPGEARCWVFLRNWVTYRDHLPLDIFGGWHLSISPFMSQFVACLAKARYVLLVSATNLVVLHHYQTLISHSGIKLYLKKM